jgi:signal transduction histidine kinase
MADSDLQNQHLIDEINKLKYENSIKLNTIQTLNKISIKLSNFQDVSTILKDILVSVQEITYADGGTIYLTDGKKLSFKHIINKSLNIQHYDCDENEEVWSYIPIDEEHKNLVSVHCALNKDIVCIDDVYHNDKYDFSGTKTFDSKINYKSETMLVVPMLLADKTLVGILQLINKLDNDNNTITFNDFDKDIAHSLASQASVAIDKFRQQKLLMQQSKLAAMGEMIDAIAHQWKQPLNVINIISSKFGMYLDMGIEIDNEMIEESTKEISQQVNHLTTTLDEFRSFLRPNKLKKVVKISEMINSVVGLLKDDLNKYEIDTQIEGDLDLSIEIVENEFKHIFINIINNAKDAFEEGKEKAIAKGEEYNLQRKIIFTLKEYIDYILITIEDNAGGIPDHIIDTIFNANVTTKEEGKGTGIGLYMSAKIVEKNNGSISVENTSNGAKFSIKLLK